MRYARSTQAASVLAALSLLLAACAAPAAPTATSAPGATDVPATVAPTAASGEATAVPTEAAAASPTADAGEAGPILRWSVEGVNELPSIDPPNAGASQSVAVINLIFEGLVRLDGDLNVCLLYTSDAADE